MKKLSLFTFGLLLAANAANAQFYFKAGVGYSVPQAGQTLDGYGTPYSGTRSNSTYKDTYSIKGASFNSGVSGLLGFGYMFSDHVGLQLDGAFGLSATKYSFANSNTNFSGYSANEQLTTQAKMPIFLIPTLVLQTGGSSDWNLYSRLGAVVPLKSTVTVNDEFYIPSQSVRVAYTSEIKSNISIGLTASAGLSYKLNDRTSLWGEVNMTSMSLFVKESKFTRVAVDGVTYPLDSIGGPHPVTYTRSGILDTNYNNFPTYAQPFSNIGFTVGITFNLSEKKRAKHDMADDRKSKSYKRKKY